MRVRQQQFHSYSGILIGAEQTTTLELGAGGRQQEGMGEGPQAEVRELGANLISWLRSSS